MRRTPLIARLLQTTMLACLLSSGAAVAADEVNAYCEAQRRATRARVRSDRAAFYHWAKVAAEVARIAPLAKMDIDVVRAVVAEEERHRT